jgi:AcrR family transcriptional regulator
MKPTKRELQKQETKKHIMAVAYSVYSEKGFSAVTSDIAKAANVSHGTIFAHFPTLKELLAALLAAFSDRLSRSLHELSARSETVEDVLKAHLDVLLAHEGFYTRLITERRLLPAELQNVFIAVQSALSFHMNTVLAKEVGAGRVKDLPPHILFNTWMGLVHYYLQNSDFFAPGASVIARYRQELTDNFMEMIKE